MPGNESAKLCCGCKRIATASGYVFLSLRLMEIVVKKLIMPALGAVAFMMTSSSAFALTAEEAYAEISAACRGGGGGCSVAVTSVLNRIGAFDNRRAIGRAIARAARDAGAEDTVDAALGSQIAGNDGVISGFDDEVGTADTGGGNGFGGEGFSGDNENDGGEGSDA